MSKKKDLLKKVSKLLSKKQLETIVAKATKAKKKKKEAAKKKKLAAEKAKAKKQAKAKAKAKPKVNAKKAKASKGKSVKKKPNKEVAARTKLIETALATPKASPVKIPKEVIAKATVTTQAEASAQCSAITTSGRQCRNQAKENGYCHVHKAQASL